MTSTKKNATKTATKSTRKPAVKTTTATEKAKRDAAAKATPKKDSAKAIAADVKILEAHLGRKLTDSEFVRQPEGTFPEGARLVREKAPVPYFRFDYNKRKATTSQGSSTAPVASSKGSKKSAKKAAANGAIPAWKAKVLERDSTKAVIAKISKATKSKPLPAARLNAQYELRLAKIAADCGLIVMETVDDAVVFYAAK